MADSSWLMADAWECSQSGWTRTALVLNELGKRLPQIDGRTVKVMMVSPAHASQPHAARPLARSLAHQPDVAAHGPADLQVCGGDLLQSFTVILENGQPLWLPEDQQIILAENGVACLERWVAPFSSVKPSCVQTGSGQTSGNLVSKRVTFYFAQGGRRSRRADRGARDPAEEQGE